MIPSFEKRVRGFAIDTSSVMVFIIVSFGLPTDLLKNIMMGLAFFGFYFLPYFFADGQTLGKKTQKTKIVRVDGTKAPIWLIILRDVFKLGLSIITFGVYMIVSFFFISNKADRAIHDYIFKTKVIDLETRQRKDQILGTSESLRRKGLE